MYHSQNGLFFDRAEKGLRIIKTSDGKDPSDDNVIFSDVISWGMVASAICANTYGDDTAERFWELMNFMGEGRP